MATKSKSTPKEKEAKKKVSPGKEPRVVGSPIPQPIDEHRIRERAHRIWLEEGKPEGRDVEHWQRARLEIEREG